MTWVQYWAAVPMHDAREGSTFRIKEALSTVCPRSAPLPSNRWERNATRLCPFLFPAPPSALRSCVSIDPLFPVSQSASQPVSQSDSQTVSPGSKNAAAVAHSPHACCMQGSPYAQCKQTPAAQLRTVPVLRRPVPGTCQTHRIADLRIPSFTPHARKGSFVSSKFSCQVGWVIG